MSPTEGIALAAQAEKLGVIGTLFLVALLACVGVWHFRRENLKLHEQLTKAKLVIVLQRQYLDNAGIKIDLSGIQGLDSLLGIER